MKTKTSTKHKLLHIAKVNDRSMSNQIERFLREKIEEWEAKNGVIPFPAQP